MKKLMSIILVLALIMLDACTKRNQSAAARSASQTYIISVGGSTSVTPLMEMFQAEYERANSNVKITISGTGSGDGIKGAAEGTYQIGMSSRELTPAELGTGLESLAVAIDGIAVIMNNAIPVSSLSLDQIRDIYTGMITRWEQLGPAANGKAGGIAVISREPGSGTRGAFQELIRFADGELVRNAIIFDGTGAIKSAVAGNIDAIAYISLGSLDNSIKALNVDGIAPAADNLKNGTYKIARPFILVIRRGVPLHPAAKIFLDWTMSGAGQSIVERNWISVN